MVKPPIQSTFKFVKSMFSGKEIRPKVPRKKLEIQFTKAIDHLQQQIQRLEEYVETSPQDDIRKHTGEQLLSDATRFFDQQLYRIGQGRLQNLPQQLIHPVDFTMFVLYRMYSFTEEIFHFLHTTKEVSI